MGRMITRCPKCSASVPVSADKAGDFASCPACLTRFVVPTYADLIWEQGEAERRRDKIKGAIWLAALIAVAAVAGFFLLPVIPVAAFVLYFSIIIVGYFLPSLNAFYRGHLNAVPILIVNVLVGWTILGWVVCFAWSYSHQPEN